MTINNVIILSKSRKPNPPIKKRETFIIILQVKPDLMDWLSGQGRLNGNMGNNT